MSNSFSVWLDDETAAALYQLARKEERKRGAMIRILIQRAIRESGTGEDKQETAVSKPS